MDKQKAANRVLEIRDEILDLLQEARELARKHTSPRQFANLDAYVFDLIDEHLEKGNPYNQDLGDAAKAILGEDQEDFE